MTNDEIKKIEEQIAKNKERIKELRKKKNLALMKKQDKKDKKILTLIKNFFDLNNEKELNYFFGNVIIAKNNLKILKTYNKSSNEQDKQKFDNLKRNILLTEQTGKKYLDVNLKPWFNRNAKSKSKAVNTSSFDFDFFLCKIAIRQAGAIQS